MTATIAVASYGVDPLRPSALVTVTGVSVGDVIDVTRQPPSEDVQRVRGAVGYVATSTTVLFPDLTPPLGRLTTYALTVNGSYVASASVTVAYTGHHLLTDVATGEGVEVQLVADADERTQPARVTVLQPAGATWPVALYDTRGSDNGTLSVFTPDRATTLQLASLLAPGRPIVSRHRSDSCDVASVEYLYPQDVTRSRYSRNGARTWSLPIIAVDLPDPTLVVVVTTLESIADYYAPTGGTLATIAADHATLLDVAQDDYGVL